MGVPFVDVVPTILTLKSLLEHTHQDLAAVVTLGGLGVRVDHKGVGDLQTVGQMKVHPGWAACNTSRHTLTAD